MKDRQFKIFVRSVAALPFIEINVLEVALDELREMQFKPTSPYYDTMVKFQNDFCQYIEDTWIQYVFLIWFNFCVTYYTFSGNFPPQLWNCFMKAQDITNNKSEAWNSRFSKVVNKNHPNILVMSAHLFDEIIKTQRDFMNLKVIFWLIFYSFSWWSEGAGTLFPPL